MLRRVLGSAALAAALLGGGSAIGDTLVSGRSAQALRCAAYIGMGAQYAYDEGYLSADDRNAIALRSVQVLQRWVPLGLERQLAAYRATLGELGSRQHAYALLARHSDWCLREFTPAS
jgi:hypothetical protein